MYKRCHSNQSAQTVFYRIDFGKYHNELIIAAIPGETASGSRYRTYPLAEIVPPEHLRQTDTTNTENRT